MNEAIKQIAERLKGLRESLDLTPEVMGERCSRRAEDVLLYESGVIDIPMSYLFEVAQQFNIDTSTLISGDEPRMTAYFLTRKGQGVAIERTKAYKYQALAGGYKRPKAEPFEVTVEPNDNPIHLNRHQGEEFNFVLEGRMLLQINGKDLILNPGDSIYFDSDFPHGMKALDNQTVKFLAIIL
ncbi:MAG: cupin domain-containing protein [Candidatus Symbiothrix sp.]|nr:cupin domain-containing protein [Candidatus Symbiothrix sp.]